MARRIILGRVQRMLAPGSQSGGDEDNKNEQGDHEAFCTCCFLMQNFDTFESFVESDKFCAIRFYAARNADGAPMADCRVNGEDYDEGTAALREYVKKWPDVGCEARKQYIVIHTVEASEAAPSEETQADKAATVATDDETP